MDAHLPPDYIGSDRLRLEAYRRLASAADEPGVAAVVDELIDRYGPLPEPAERLVAVARLRLLCRHYGVTELAATGTGSATTLRVSPLALPDSAQVRLTRLYPSARYRATTATVQVRCRAPPIRWAPADPRHRTAADGGRSPARS